jgi:hypothetical protein
MFMASNSDCSAIADAFYCQASPNTELALGFGGDGELNRQIDGLVASGSGIVGSGLGGQGGVAMGTGVGDQGEEVIDGVEGLQGTDAALVTELAAALSCRAGKSGRAFGVAGASPRREVGRSSWSSG